MAEPLHCGHCRAPVHPGRGDYYVVQIESVADPFPPVITAEDLALDLDREFEALHERLQSMSEQQLEKQVCRRELLHLCLACYRRWCDLTFPKS